MALVVPSHTQSPAADRTAPLNQALQNFEQILDDKQSQQYHASRTKPDASSVLEFVAKIDADSHSRAGRCVSSRLCSFLDAIQQFAGVVETFVSSKPTRAALIWGSVKTAILAASNIASYFDKVTHKIMDIGLFCPTYQQSGELYSGCVGLQGALSEYYAIVVSLCAKIIEVSRRKIVTQIVSSLFIPFESDFKPYEDELRQAVQNVLLQVSLASKLAQCETARLLELDRKQNAADWHSTLGFQKEARKEQAEARQLRMRKEEREVSKIKSAIRANLSRTDHVKPWKQAMKQRMPDTAEWFQREDAFCDWRDNNDTAILWCSGTLGMGKTVIVSNIIAYLYRERNQSDVISYYLCCSEYEDSLQARNVLGSLARQLLDHRIEHARDKNLIGLYNSSQGLDAADMVDFLISYLEGDTTYYVVLDGVDECESAQIQIISHAVSKLCQHRLKGLKILCTGRPELETEFFTIQKPKYRMALTVKKTEPDMYLYITTALDQCLDNEQLKLGDPELILKIEKALREGYNGMFLWTRLIIEELCVQRTDNDISKALEQLPRSLSQLLNQKLARVERRPGAPYARKILQYCGVAERPLTTEEFREVLSVSPGQKSLDRWNLPNDVDRIIADCCGLAFTDEEENTVHYAHHSSKKHLFREHVPHSYHFIAADLQKQFGFLCITYLDFNDFKWQITKRGSAMRLDPVRLAIVGVSRPGSTSNRLAQILLRKGRRSQAPSAIEFEEMPKSC